MGLPRSTQGGDLFLNAPSGPQVFKIIWICRAVLIKNGGQGDIIYIGNISENFRFRRG